MEAEGFSGGERALLSGVLRQRLQSGVRLLLFAHEGGCSVCSEAASFGKRLNELEGKLEVAIHPVEQSQSLMAELGVISAPAMVLSPKPGIKFYGTPKFQLLKPFAEALLYAAGEPTNLAEAMKERLKSIAKPMKVRLFTLPSCPHSAAMASLACRFAAESPNLSLDIFDAGVFPGLVKKHRVEGVPKAVINEAVELLGAQQESGLLYYLTIASRRIPLRVPVRAVNLRQHTPLQH